MRRVTQGVWAVLAMAMALLAVSGAGCAPRRPAAAPPPAGDLPLPPAPVVLAANAMEVLWNTQALIAPDSHLTAVWVVGDFLVCHGSDHRIYVIDAKTGVRLWSRDVAAPHEAVWPPAIDAKGNLYMTFGNEVAVFSPAGQRIATFPMPESTTNVTFGGKNRDILFITCPKGAYTLQMQVKGR